MQLEVLSDFSEIIPYPIPDFPLFAGYGTLEAQNQYTVNCHWHNDFEFNLVLKGSMDYFINGEDVHLDEGDGIFVNSRRMHYNYSRDKSPCKYLVITISPDLLPKAIPAVGGLLENITDIKCSNYIILRNPGCQSMLDIYPQILKEVQKGNPNSFTTLSYAMCLLCKVTPMIRTDAHGKEYDAKWLSLYDMTKFIHTHYRKNITLADIASSGKVCRSKCCQIFSKFMGQSPIEYLIIYRLEKSQALLLHTDCTIGEVASKCGFNGQSYYAQLFRKVYGVTPREYRKQ